MKLVCLFIFLMPYLFMYGQSVNDSPLSAYSAEWNKEEYNKCNTAIDITYLSVAEKEVIYILNLVRSYPLLFVKTVLAKYPLVSDKDYLLKDKKYFLSLIKTLGEMEPLEIVLSLLIDEGVPSLGHRKILLGNYSQIGLSIKPHKKYETNTVIDLW